MVQQLVNIAAINAAGCCGCVVNPVNYRLEPVQADLRSNLLVLIQEYQDEISTLTADLTSARDQTGVFMSKEKYQALMDQMNRQKIAIDQEKVGRSRE